MRSVQVWLSLKVSGVDRWTVSRRTASRCLLAYRNKTAEVEHDATRQGKYYILLSHGLPVLEVMSCEAAMRKLNLHLNRQRYILTKLKDDISLIKTFKLINTCLISCRESGPGLVGSAVIVLGIRDLYIVTESDKNFGLPQLLYSGPLAQLEQEERKRL